MIKPKFTSYHSNVNQYFDNSSFNDHHKKAIILISTLINLLKAKSLQNIFSLMTEFESELSINFSSTFFLINIMYIIKYSSKSLNYQEQLKSLVIKYNKLILNENNCHFVNVVFALCYFSTMIKSSYYITVEDELINELVTLLKGITHENISEFNIDLVNYCSIYDKLFFLQICHQKIKYIHPSFDKFVSQVDIGLLCKEGAEMKKILISQQLDYCNASYELDKTIILIDKNNKNNENTEQMLKRVKESQDSLSEFNLESTIEKYINDEEGLLMLKEKYLLKHKDVEEFKDFIALCFDKFCQSSIQPISNDDYSSKIPIWELRKDFNQEFLNRKEYYINLFSKSLFNDQKRCIKIYIFTNQYKKFLFDIQERLNIKS